MTTTLNLRLFALLALVCAALSMVFSTLPAHASAEKVAGKAIAIIKKDREICGEVPLPYRLDCLRNQLKSVKNKIRREAGYREAGKIFAEAEAKIDAIVKANIDPELKTIRVKGRKLRPIKASAIKTAERQMLAVLKETSDALLRSESRAAKHYVKIAQAVDSNKLLMRS